MSNQIDVGWSAPPFGLDQLDQGKIRIIAVGNDASLRREAFDLLAALCRQT